WRRYGREEREGYGGGSGGASRGLFWRGHRGLGQGSTLTPRSAMSASPWRVLSGYTTYQRPHEKAFWGERGTLDTDRPRRSPFCWAVAHRGGAYLKSPQIKVVLENSNVATRASNHYLLVQSCAQEDRADTDDA